MGNFITSRRIKPIPSRVEVEEDALDMISDLANRDLFKSSPRMVDDQDEESVGLLKSCPSILELQDESVTDLSGRDMLKRAFYWRQDARDGTWIAAC